MAEGYPRRPRAARGRSSSRERRQRPDEIDRANEQKGYYQNRGQVRPELLPFDRHGDLRPRQQAVDETNELLRGRGAGGFNGQSRRRGGGRGRGRVSGSFAGGDRPTEGWKSEWLEELSVLPPDEVVSQLYEGLSKLKDYIRRRNIRHPKELANLSHVLDKVTRSEKNELSARLLAVVFYPDNSTAYWSHAMLLVKKMPIETNSEYRRKNVDVLKRLCGIFKCALERVPQTVLFTLPVNDLASTIKALGVDSSSKNLGILADELQALHAVIMSDRVKNAAQQAQSSQSKGKKMTEEVASQHSRSLPFGDFREISILPSVEELDADHDLGLHSRVRTNLVEGKYIDWDHYFDVHFRLLREDFISPLREGLSLHLAGQQKRNTNIRVYSGVHILEPVCHFGKIVFEVKFDVSRLSQIKWEHSKRLIFGSLLCLSSDNFRNIHFATVVRRDVRQLLKGIITVRFEDDTDGFRMNPSHDYTMVESSAFFEAYRHVLKRLQDINKDVMPFKSYLLDAKCKVEPPLYLQNQKDTLFDLHDVLGISQRSITGKHVDVLDRRSWPAQESTLFDASQMEAMQMALTQSISVIQGPPGTGKTYVGVRIVEALLTNKQKWRKGISNPILVVCYTNHALDQFLEYIQALSSQPNIVRIGGRAKSEAMQACSLHNLVQDQKKQRNLPHHLFKKSQAIGTELFLMKKQLETASENVSAEEGKLLSYQDLKLAGCIDQRFQDQIEAHMVELTERDVGKELEIWLELWYPIYSAPPDLTPQALAQKMSQMKIPTSEPQGDQHQQAANGPVKSNEEQEDEGVDVDEEAKLAEDHRKLEGEEALFFGHGELHKLKPRKRIDPPPQDTGEMADSDGWTVTQVSKKERHRRMCSGLQTRAMSPHQARQVGDIFKLQKVKKWALYQYWAQEFIARKKSEAQQFAEKYELIGQEFSQIRLELDLHVLNSADVIGMTTTGAAKYNNILERIVPKIVVLEEAAEVLESHIVSCLSSGAQQLILIGDHKQLRPKPTTYELVKKCKMDVSLFERLASNGYPHATLQIQHRMAPDIRKLVHPHIYQTLWDHDSVLRYPKISGIGRHLFFIDHCRDEDPSDHQDLLSHSNQFEVDFLVGLCRYLLKQGIYKQQQITILTMYKGQLLKLKHKMPKTEFDGVRVAAVDDFQGEENDIILLSLVRSNSDGNIGFLRDQNRVCVALSRAKWGLYVIGNFELLRTKDETIWPQIIEDVERRRFMGMALPLYCLNHAETKTVIVSPSDFSKVPEGGCSKTCGVRLSCGHACKRVCHIQDREHKVAQCSEPCPNILSCGHRCTRRCHQCANGCLPCCIPVSKKLSCGHLMTLQCGISTDKVACQQTCKKILPGCGHQCTKPCCELCPAKCDVKLLKRLPCGHYRRVPCSVEPRDVICHELCKNQLECGHSCPGSCSRCTQGRLHQPCRNKCGRTLACGHACSFPCTSECPPCEKACNNYCNHSKCPKMCKDPCQPCMEKCQWKCPHFTCTMKCGEPCNRRRCNQPCKKTLKCKHPCIGLCGEECPTLCRFCDNATVTEIFLGEEGEPDARFIQLKDCGHIIEVNGLDQWMDQETTGDESKGREIQFKQCPKCKTPVRRSLRYGNIIKRTLADMEKVKKHILAGGGVVVDLTALLSDLTALGTQMRTNAHCAKMLASHVQAVKEGIRNSKSPSYHTRQTYKIHCSVIVSVAKLIERIDNLHTDVPVFAINDTPLKCQEILQEMSTVVVYTCEQKSFFPQQTSDINTELRRLRLLVSWCEIAHKVGNEQAQQLTADNLTQLVRIMQHCRLSGLHGKAEKLTENEFQQMKTVLDDLRGKCGVLGISENEREMIVKAMGLTMGHWYMCPNNHAYCITECGGATEESVCPTCKAAIGGTQHRLLSTNRVATEMDGARHPAYGEVANQEMFQNLQARFGERFV